MLSDLYNLIFKAYVQLCDELGDKEDCDRFFTKDREDVDSVDYMLLTFVRTDLGGELMNFSENEEICLSCMKKRIAFTEQYVLSQITNDTVNICDKLNEILEILDKAVPPLSKRCIKGINTTYHVINKTN